MVLYCIRLRIENLSIVIFYVGNGPVCKKYCMAQFFLALQMLQSSLTTDHPHSPSRNIQGSSQSHLALSMKSDSIHSHMALLLSQKTTHIE
jgi:hypothetical protein